MSKLTTNPFLRGTEDKSRRNVASEYIANRGKPTDQYGKELKRTIATELGFEQRTSKVDGNVTASEIVNKRGSSGKGISNPNFYYSFSGADCDVYAFRNGGDLHHLDSIATVSVSIYEAKAPVRRLGYAAPVGFSGSIRSIAGSIVCILQKEHPLKGLMDIGYSKHLDDAENREVAGRIFPFNLMLMYKNEVGNGLSMQIDNVEIISEGIVTSVNDIATEVVLQFVATEMHQLKVNSNTVEMERR